MEYLFGIVAVIFIVIVLGNIKGAPDPKTMSDSQIQNRLQTEGAWIKKFYRLPFEHQLNLTLQKKYEEKKKYIQELKLEFASRQTSPNIVPNFQNISIEMQPILDKINEHMQSGLSEPEAIKATLVQYRDKDSVSLKNADTIQKNPTEITKDRLGNVIKVDQRSEEEKEIAFRKHIQNKRDERRRNACDYNVESAIESICSRTKQGNSLEQAIYSVTNFNKITEETINDIEAEKNNGLSDELALRVTLQKFSSREQT